MYVEPSYSFTAENETIWINLGLGAVWHVIHDGDDLGSYSTAEEAAWALANGRCPLPWAWRRLCVALPERLERWNMRSISYRSSAGADAREQTGLTRQRRRSF